MMLTRCPACSTAFRVSPDQLKVRSGRVRCGQCQAQFNALDTLVEENVASAGPVPTGPGASESSAEPNPSFAYQDAAANEVEQVARVEQHVEHTDEFDSEHAAEEIFDEEEPQEIVAEMASEFEEDVLPATAEVNVESQSLPEEAYDTSFDDVPEEAIVVKPRRWPWVLGAIAASLALAAQAAMHFRVELAVLQPQMKPTLVAACKKLGCEVLLPQHAEFLGIEASDLHPDPLQKGQLILSATLRNHAPFAQELPVIELTLNDTADHPLIVKDIKPREYLPLEVNPARGFPSNGELAVNLTLDVGDVSAAGYRIYLFYP